MTESEAQMAIRSRQHLEAWHGYKFTADELEKYRVVVLNTWRPITAGPLRREPLAVCDNRTIAKSDLCARRTDIGKRESDPRDDFALEIYLATFNP